MQNIAERELPSPSLTTTHAPCAANADAVAFTVDAFARSFAAGGFLDATVAAPAEAGAFHRVAGVQVARPASVWRSQPDEEQGRNDAAKTDLDREARIIARRWAAEVHLEAGRRGPGGECVAYQFQPPE
jgi:hypothetical protein